VRDWRDIRWVMRKREARSGGLRQVWSIPQAKNIEGLVYCVTVMVAMGVTVRTVLIWCQISSFRHTLGTTWSVCRSIEKLMLPLKLTKGHWCHHLTLSGTDCNALGIGLNDDDRKLIPAALRVLNQQPCDILKNEVCWIEQSIAKNWKLLASEWTLCNPMYSFMPSYQDSHLRTINMRAQECIRLRMWTLWAS